MHTWKPDAYREAPSPAVVLMAVGMLNGALYCILRIHLISKASLGPEFSEGLLLTLGLLSVLIATPFVLIQWNIKRLLAYSSIEHVGIMAIGVGLGAQAAVFGALLHMTYHSLAKPVALFSAGTLAQLHSSSDFDQIGRGTIRRAPVTSALFVLATVIITGSPPFGLFFSEMMILRAGFAGSHLTVTSVFLAALIVLFCGFAYQAGHLVLGPPRPLDRASAATRTLRHRDGDDVAGGGRRRCVRVLLAGPADGAHPCGDAGGVGWSLMSVVATVSNSWTYRSGPFANAPRRTAARDDTSALSGFADRVTHDLSGRLLSLFASDERSPTGASFCTMCGRCRGSGPSCALGAGRSGRTVCSRRSPQVSGGQLVRTRGHGFLRPCSGGPSEPDACRSP